MTSSSQKTLAKSEIKDCFLCYQTLVSHISQVVSVFASTATCVGRLHCMRLWGYHQRSSTQPSKFSHLLAALLNQKPRKNLKSIKGGSPLGLSYKLSWTPDERLQTRETRDWTCTTGFPQGENPWLESSALYRISIWLREPFCRNWARVDCAGQSKSTNAI